MTELTEVLVKALRIDWGCHQGVIEDGEHAPCEKPAVAIMRPWDGDGPAYPVCAGHIQPAYLTPITEWRTDD
ncbi:hypothetical protein [Nesterenkonia rhizosphaerae]|uniref:Uncharacterized protein n=1 Tax=Nesterenkonia rhizosphaerae TaxID=1348272 RepID=A0ABP9FTJ7_9MICC